MNILLFSHDKSLFRDGSESQRRMAERGNICDSLTILVPTRPGFSRVQLAPNVQVVPTNSKNAFWSYWALKSHAKKIAREKKIQLIVSQDPFEFGWIARGIAKKFDLPWQAELHGDFYTTGFWKWSTPTNFARHYLGKFILRHAASIRVVSERLRANLVFGLGIPDSRVTVFPVEVDTHKYLESPKGSFLKEKYGNFDFFLLTVGILNPVKNIDMQIRAMHDVVEKYPKTALVVVGDGPDRQLLNILAHKMRVAQNVIFTGTQKDLLPYYMGADAFLLTSHAEGWGRVVVEAMAAGLPAIMTDVGLAGELLIHGKNGMVIGRKNERVLTKSILQVREDAALRTRLGDSARDSVRTLPSHEAVLKKYKESWEKAVR